MGDSSDEVQHMEGELYEFLPDLDVGELEIVFEKMGETCPESAKTKKNVINMYVCLGSILSLILGVNKSS